MLRHGDNISQGHGGATFRSRDTLRPPREKLVRSIKSRILEAIKYYGSHPHYSEIPWSKITVDVQHSLTRDSSEISFLINFDCKESDYDTVKQSLLGNGSPVLTLNEINGAILRRVRSSFPSITLHLSTDFRDYRNNRSSEIWNQILKGVQMVGANYPSDPVTLIIFCPNEIGIVHKSGEHIKRATGLHDHFQISVPRKYGSLTKVFPRTVEISALNYFNIPSDLPPPEFKTTDTASQLISKRSQPSNESQEKVKKPKIPNSVSMILNETQNGKLKDSSKKALLQLNEVYKTTLKSIELLQIPLTENLFTKLSKIISLEADMLIGMTPLEQEEYASEFIEDKSLLLKLLRREHASDELRTSFHSFMDNWLSELSTSG